MRMICFDMDGTIADLYNVDNWLEKLRNNNPTPYLAAQPIYDMKALCQVLETLRNSGWEIRVISWLAKNGNPAYDYAVRQCKRAWLRAYNLPIDKVHLVKYGTTKANCVRKEVDSVAILVDDNAKIRKGWKLGMTIDPTKGDLLQKLEELI